MTKPKTEVLKQSSRCRLFLYVHIFSIWELSYCFEWSVCPTFKHEIAHCILDDCQSRV